MGFRDHFSAHAADYARHRPSYPPDLFAQLAALAPGIDLAWDCGTGNGQAARALAAHFARVLATDASRQQLAQAAPAAAVGYAVAVAERAPLRPASVDLVTVAQALHWFDLEAFYREARRVLRTGGVLAAWCYGLVRITPLVDAVVDRLYRDVVGAYWPPERRHVENGYASLPFPFEPVSLPPVEMALEWTPEHLVHYIRTWSAMQRYRRDRGDDPLGAAGAELRRAWGEPRARLARFPLTVRAGRPA